MIKQSFQIDVELSEDYTNGTVAILMRDLTLNPLDITAAAMTATEHMMTNFCLMSNLEFEDALKLLCDGARINKILYSQGGIPI